MKRVNLESPYAGEIGRNVNYAREALSDSLRRGEAPFASHLLYTQPGVLDDSAADERETGFSAGDAWRLVAQLTAFYVDLGWSSGMLRAKDICDALGQRWEERRIEGWKGGRS